MTLPDQCLRIHLDRSPDGVLIEHENAIAWINTAYLRLLGYERRELIGRETALIVAPHEHERLQRFSKCRAAGEAAPERYRFTALGSDHAPRVVDASVSSAMVDARLYITTIVRSVEPPKAEACAELLEKLTPREHDIAVRTIRGERPKEIAFSLAISEKTVATHRARIFAKLSLRHDLDLYRLAAERGLLSS